MSRSADANMIRGSMLSFARLLTGVVRVKVLALALGVSGVGIYALLLQLNTVGIAAVSMSLAVPIINLGRPRLASGDVSGAGRIAGTALAIVAVNALLIATGAALFGDDLLQYIGAGSLDADLLWPLITAILLGAVTTAFWEGMSYLADRFDIYVRVGITAALSEMVCVSVGAATYGLRGAVFALPAGPIVLFAAYAFLLARDKAARQVLTHLSASFSGLPKLLSYSAMMFGAVALTQLGLATLRTQVLLNASPVANGYLQTVTSISAYILAFVTTGFWGHLHARAAAAGDTPEVRKELHNALQIGLLIAFTGCGAAAALSDYLIPLFYSGEFSAAAQLMVAYMPGEFCFQLLSILIAYQLTVSRRRRYLAWSLGYVGLLVAIGIATIPTWGAWGYVVGHNIAALAMLVIAAFTALRSGQISGRIVGLSASLWAVMAGVSAGMLNLRAAGFGGAIGLLAMIPFATSGFILALRLGREFRIPWLARPTGP